MALTVQDSQERCKLCIYPDCQDPPDSQELHFSAKLHSPDCPGQSGNWPCLFWTVRTSPDCSGTVRVLLTVLDSQDGGLEYY